MTSSKSNGSKAEANNEEKITKLSSKEWIAFRDRLTSLLEKEGKTKTLEAFNKLLDNLEKAVSKDDKSRKKDLLNELNDKLKRMDATATPLYKKVRRKVLDMRRKAKMSEIGVTKTVKKEFKEAFKLAKSQGAKLKNHSQFVARLLEQSLY